MKITTSLLFYVALNAVILMSSGCFSAPKNTLYGDWIVIESACNNCKPHQEPEAHIIITQKIVKNPFGMDCDSKIALTTQQTTTTTAIFKKLALPSSWMPTSGNQQDASELMLTCDGIDNGHFILLDNENALMRYEAETVFRLRRGHTKHE